MIFHKEIATKPLENGNSAKRILENFYIKNCFESYLKGLNRADGTLNHSASKYKYHIMSQVIEYVDGLFTLPQLYCIFDASVDDLNGWGADYMAMNDFKTYVINIINETDEYENDLDDIENFKNKVLELNPITFTVLNDIFYESNMFDDDYCEGYRYPDISNDENVCANELKELIWTHNAIEKTEAICKKFHNINERVAALTIEGYEIKTCWVGPGGINSTFYMYNKREIRIQIAASRFKGKGNRKSKSALCVVIPYPAFLHKNRIKNYDYQEN